MAVNHKYPPAAQESRPATQETAQVGLTTATACTLLALADESGGRADALARRLGRAIRLGLLIDGERLPAESVLAQQMGVSTVTLREALSCLREQGLVVTRRGRTGGTFVRAPADAREPLLQFSVQELQELGDQRAAIIGAAARLAAERALDREITGLEEQVERIAIAVNASERRRADTQLTIAIGAAAQSSRLTREVARLHAEVGDLLGLVPGDGEHQAIVRERRRLVAAIRRRKPAQARRLAELQVAAETRRLIELRLQMAAPAAGATPDAPPGVTPRELAPREATLGEVVAELGEIFTELGGLAAELAGLYGASSPALSTGDLAALRPTIFEMLARQGGLASGAGVVAAPGLLSDTDHWLEWWSTVSAATGPGAKPQLLRVNLDPRAPDFYDYTNEDWFTIPRRTLQPCMAGPFVDFACTKMYALTLSAPVLIDGRFRGVAAVDVLIASLEQRVLPALVAAGTPLALTTADGRVIVSGDAGVTSGQSLQLPGRPMPGAGLQPRLLDSLRLVELG